MFQTIARFTPFALLRRYLAVREAEIAVRRDEVAKEIPVALIWEDGWQACERKLTGAAT